LLAELSTLEGVEFILAATPGDDTSRVFYGLENAKPVAQWMEQSMENFRALGDRLHAGQLQQMVGVGPQLKVTVASVGKTELCVGFVPTLAAESMRETMKKVMTRWAS